MLTQRTHDFRTVKRSTSSLEVSRFIEILLENDVPFDGILRRWGHTLSDLT